MLAPDPEVREATIKELQMDLKMFQLLRMQVGDGSAPKYLLDRHCFHLMPVVQLVEVMREAAWTLTPEVTAWLQSFHSRILGSQVCEDGLKDCRSLEHRNENRKANVKSLFHRLIVGSTLSMRHSYQQPPVSPAQVVRGAALPDAAYHASAKKATVNVAGVKGDSQKTDWFSPIAERTSLPYADLHLLSLAYNAAEGRLRSMDSAWMNQIAAGKNLVIRKKQRSASQWLFPVGAFSDSVCLCVPAKVHRFQGKQFFALPSAGCQLVTIFIEDLADWEAVGLVWLSPLGQQRAMGQLGACNRRKQQPELPLAIRAMADPVISPSGASPLLQVAARSAFWKLPGVLLKKLARHLDIQEVGAWGLGGRERALSAKRWVVGRAVASLGA